MANRPIGMEVLEQIRLMNNLGVGKKAIARQLGISKNTVKEYLSKEQNVTCKENPPAIRLMELQSFFPYCKEELARTGVTRQILWGEYREK